MDELSGMLSQIMNDPQSMRQIQELASSLGLSGDGGAQSGSQPESGGFDMSALTSLLGGLQSGGGQTDAPQKQPESGGFDMSALTSLLGGLQSGGGQTSAPQKQPEGGGLDMSALTSLLGGLQSGGGQTAAPQKQPESGGLDMSALASLLGGAQTSAPANSAPDLSSLSSLISGLAGGGNGGGDNISALTSLLGGAGKQQHSPPQNGLPFDLSTLLKLQKAMSSVGGNRKNVELLMALKPRLKEQRAKKVDDAVRVMQLIQFLPLIKESGLFGDDSGLGGIVNGLGDGLNSVIGNLFGGRR